MKSGILGGYIDKNDVKLCWNINKSQNKIFTLKS